MARQKTQDEIQAIEAVQRSTEKAFAAAIEYLRIAESPSSEEAHAIIDRILEAEDCESPIGHVVAGGEQAVEPHEKGTGPIEKGVSIVIDIFPRSKKTGYWADMSRTVCIGEPNAEVQKMYDTVLAVQEMAIEMIKPGVACKDIQEAAEKYFKDAGYETSGKGKEFSYAEGFVHSIGHGVGKEIHEVPHISRKSEEVLLPGDVITIEPGLYYHDLGGVRIEDLLLVTENSYRNLTDFSKEFVI